MNILSVIRDQLSPELLGQVSKSIGESPEATRNALGFSLPALLGSAAARASSPDGASSLFNLLKEKMPQGGWASYAAGLAGNLTGGGAGGLGSSLVSSLLGSKAGLVQDFIAGRAGIRGSSASTLLGTCGQMLMGTLGSQVTSQGLGPSGFGELLRSQFMHLQGLIPPELSGMLGISNLLNPTKTATAVASTPPPSDITPATPTGEAVPSAGSKALRWAIVPLALLLGVLLLTHRSQRNREENAGAAADTTWSSQDAATAASTNLQLPRPDVTALTDRFSNAIANGETTPIDLTGVAFDSSGTLSSAAKTPLAALGRMINENSAISGKISAYGKTPEEAAARSNSIKSWLLSNGVTSQRLVIDPQIGDSVPNVSFSR